MKILFVCFRNSERSVIAELLYNKLSKTNNAKSAGIRESNKPRSENLYKLMLEEGIDATKHPKRVLTPEILLKYTKVYILCRKREWPDFLHKAKNVIYWKVPNPHGKDLNFLRKTKNLIKKLVSEIIP